MKNISDNEGKKLLFGVLEKTLIENEDILFLKELVENNNSSLPMKGVIYYYDKMKKKEITKEDKDILNELMYFFGP